MDFSFSPLKEHLRPAIQVIPVPKGPTKVAWRFRNCREIIPQWEEQPPVTAPGPDIISMVDDAVSPLVDSSRSAPRHSLIRLVFLKVLSG
jgi:hypothetical protein